MISILKDARRYWGERRASVTRSVQNVAETSDGKKMLLWLRRYVCAMDEAPIASDGDPVKTGYMIGRQSVWLEIQAEINKELSLELRAAQRIEEDQERIVADLNREEVA